MCHMAGRNIRGLAQMHRHGGASTQRLFWNTPGPVSMVMRELDRFAAIVSSEVGWNSMPTAPAIARVAAVWRNGSNSKAQAATTAKAVCFPQPAASRGKLTQRHQRVQACFQQASQGCRKCRGRCWQERGEGHQISRQQRDPAQPGTT